MDRTLAVDMDAIDQQNWKAESEWKFERRLTLLKVLFDPLGFA